MPGPPGIPTFPDDQYCAIREIGRGGMAIVYLADDLKHDRQVAIKVLRHELSGIVGQERFRREIQVVSHLQHPNILPVHDSGTRDAAGGDLLFYVMPFVEGESLRQRMAREGQLPVEESIGIAREVLAALGAAHAHGIVHRDIKPENILLSGGHALVADFGIAKAVGEGGGERLTETGLAIGTPSYMSPEQAAAERDVDARSDLYSVGCVLYEMLAGEPPFIGPTAHSILVKRMTEPVPSVRRLRETVPSGVETAITRSLARAPADRFPSAAEFTAALVARDTDGATPSLPRTGRRFRASLMAGAAVLLLGLAGALWFRGGTGAPGARQRLALTNLVATDGDSSVAYLRSGIPDYLVSSLLRIPGLDVVPMSLTRRDSALTSPVELGRKLGAGAVLTGTLGHHGRSLLINYELVQVADGRLRWSGQFEYPDSDYAGLLPALVAVIVDSLQLELRGTDREVAIRHATVDPVVLDVLLRGRLWWTRAVAGGAVSDSASLDSARVAFERVLDRTQQNAQAIAGLGVYHTLSYLRGWTVPGLTQAQTYARGDSLIRHALALDSTIAESWNWLGLTRLYVEDDFDGAREAFERLTAIDSGFAEGFRFRGIVRQEVDGDLPGALADFRRSVKLDSTTATLNSLGAGLMAARQYAAAATVLERSMAVRKNANARTRLITIYERLGRRADAAQLRREADSTGARAAPFEAALAARDTFAYRLARRAELRRSADSLIERLARIDATPGDRFNVAELRIGALLCELGDSKKAMDLIEDLYRIRPKRLRWIVTNVDLACLRDDPRYLPMVKAAGLEPYLRN